MRAALCFPIALLSACGGAQVSVAVAIARSAQVLSKRDPTKGAVQKPIEPSGFPGLPPKQGALPVPADDTGQGRVRILKAGELSRKGNQLRITNGAHIQYRGYDIVSDVVEGDLDTEVFDAIGNVRVFGKDADVSGERVRVDVPSRTYRAWNAEGQLEPTLLQGQFLDPLYVKAEESNGSQRELFATHAQTTTCNLADPHYHLDSRHATIRPGVRAIFRNVRLDVLGKKLITLPYLSVPLSQPNYRYLPEFGRNEQDGYFMKARYGFPLRGEDNFDARLDIFEKRGTGFGGDYSYLGKAAAGLLTIYALGGASQTLNLNNRHEQKLGWGTLTLDSAYQKNNFLTAPEATLLSTRAMLAIPQGLNQSRLTFYKTSSQSGSFDSSQQTIALQDIRRFGRLTKTNLDLGWVTSSGSFGREQVDVKLHAEHDLRRALAKFDYQRSIPVGEVQNFFSGSDRTPVIALVTDARRIFGSRAPKNMPFNTELSVGEFVDASTRDQVTRSAFDLNFQRPDVSKNRTKLSVNGRFRQGIYSDDTAQYVLAFGGQLSYSLGADTGLNLRYNYLRPYGFAPLSIDRTGRTNLLTADLSSRPARWLLVGAQTGYDLEIERLGTRTPWQFVGVRTEVTPVDWLSLRALSTYDTQQQVWNSIRLDFAYRPGATFVSLGTQYDGVRQVWGSANLFVDALKWGRLSVSAILQYNGYLKAIQAQHYSLIYDLHCAEAVLQVSENQTGFRSGRQINFFLRLKALPSTSPFGVGTLGQPLGTGTGRRF